MDTLERRWRAEHQGVCEALERAGAVVRPANGFAYVDTAKAPELARLHAALSQVGFARGWL